MFQNPVQQHKAASQENASPEQEGKGKSLTPPAFQLKASEGLAAPPPADSAAKGGGGLPGDLVNGFAASTGHDLSDVNVVRNSDKPAGVGALAYAQGNDIHLAAGQEQHLAHEAAHIVQQREGRVQATTQIGGMAVNDNKGLESEADNMGAKAMQMKSASAQPAQRKAAHGPSQFKLIQRKATSQVAQLYAVLPVASQTPRQWPAGVDLRVADNGHAVASVDRGQKICYLDPWVIAQSNRELAAKNSGITLQEQPDTLRGQAPNGGGMRTLKKIIPTIAHSSSGSGSGQNSWQDCGRMSREVMGPAGADQAPGAMVNTPGGDLQRTAPSFQPSEQFDNALVAAGLAATPAAARAAYLAMTPADREAFDRRHGLNRYAAPSVGEAFSTQNANPDFNFHWGGVIATPGGGDRVTLQNFARGNGYDSQNQLWYIEMYGAPSHPGQTWHDQWHHPAMESFTTRTSTQSLTGTVNAAGVRLVDQVANWNDPAHYTLLANATQVQKIGTQETDWIRVRVLAGPQAGHTGYIMAHYFTGS